MIKVLVVEDEDFIRKGLIGTFDWTNFQCVIIGEGENGCDGLKKIEELKPDLVITDIRMPKMNGIEMIRKAKHSVDFETFFLTSYDDFSYAKEAIDLRVQEYILKPIDEDNLGKALDKFRDFYEEKKLVSKFKASAKKNEHVELINIDDYKNNCIYDRHIKRIIDYIVSDYDGKISIEDISYELNISPSYLSRKFKEQTSNTFHEFLNKYRIQKSIELLKSGDYKVYEISDKVGFCDYKHFSSVFKKYMYYSPSEYLKKCIR
ncbi:MAG: response regulator [Clostridium sp.]|nr:response regulator [Clostridium sp.]